MATVYKSIFTGPEIDAKLSERVPSTPSGSPLHYLFVAAGAVWDTSSESWTVGSVTGISNSVMTRIYSLSHNVLNNSNWDSVLESVDIPVNLPPRKSPSRTSSSIRTTARSTFRASNFKTIYLCPKSQFVSFSDCSLLFFGCQQLVTIVGGMTFTSAITITVHADVYAKLTDPQQADWYAVNTAAQGKQISFATA